MDEPAGQFQPGVGLLPPSFMYRGARCLRCLCVLDPPPLGFDLVVQVLRIDWRRSGFQSDEGWPSARREDALAGLTYKLHLVWRVYLFLPCVTFLTLSVALTMLFFAVIFYAPLRCARVSTAVRLTD